MAIELEAYDREGPVGSMDKAGLKIRECMAADRTTFFGCEENEGFPVMIYVYYARSSAERILSNWPRNNSSCRSCGGKAVKDSHITKHIVCMCLSVVTRIIMGTNGKPGSVRR